MWSTILFSFRRFILEWLPFHFIIEPRWIISSLQSVYNSSWSLFPAVINNVRGNVPLSIWAKSQLSGRFWTSFAQRLAGISGDNPRSTRSGHKTGTPKIRLYTFHWTAGLSLAWHCFIFAIRQNTPQVGFEMADFIAVVCLFQLFVEPINIVAFPTSTLHYSWRDLNGSVRGGRGGRGVQKPTPVLCRDVAIRLRWYERHSIRLDKIFLLDPLKRIQWWEGAWEAKLAILLNCLFYAY